MFFLLLLLMFFFFCIFFLFYIVWRWQRQPFECLCMYITWIQSTVIEFEVNCLQFLCRISINFILLRHIIHSNVLVSLYFFCHRRRRQPMKKPVFVRQFDECAWYNNWVDTVLFNVHLACLLHRGRSDLNEII